MEELSKDLSEYCHPGSTFTDRMIEVTDRVSLRVISFTPAAGIENPPVLFVAGMISQVFGWREVLKEMTKDFPVHYVETREKISSEVVGKADYSVEAIREDLLALVDHFNFQQRSYILLGSSLGGTAILDACRFLTRDPLCLVLIGPNAVFRVPLWSLVIIKLFPPLLYSVIKPAVKWYLRTFRLDPESDYVQYEKYSTILDLADPWKLKRAMLAASEYDVWDFLENIEYPALIIGGSKDIMHDPGNLEKMVSMLKNGTYLDMETNTLTHSKFMVERMQDYVGSLETSPILRFFQEFSK